MPHASLLAITSPMLLGPLPPVAIVEASVAAPHAVTFQAPESAQPTSYNGSTDASVPPLVWALAAAQQQAEGGQDVGPQDETGEDDPDTTENEKTITENEIVVQGEYGPPAGDPIAAINETSYRITQDLDNAFVEPLAYAYRDGLPGPLRDGVSNVVRNLGEPSNFLNYLLQFKIGKAFETLGRFAINSTLGIGGLIDVAGKPGIDLPYRRNGFANTLGFYGVDTGAYLYLPITGATTVRDLIGNTLDQALLPWAVGAPFDRFEYAATYFVLNGLDSRLEVDAELEALDNTVDPYAARRDTYLARRARDIALLRGEEPPEPPEILRELEAELNGTELEYEDDEGDLDPLDGPDLSLDFQREMPPIAETVTITQPTTR